MYIKNTFLTFILVLLSFVAIAGSGDTIVVQTIDFNTPVLPGGNSPRSGKYLFPPDTMSFSKILMYYTLKCDPNQNPNCGEWDYTTTIHYIEHTGEYDSNLYYHANYMVNNESPDSFLIMNDTSWRYKPVLEYFNSTIPTYEAEVNDGDSTLSLPLEDATADGRFQVIYSATDLQAAGFQSGQITGLKMNVLSGTIFLRHFTVRIRNFNNYLSGDSIINGGLQTVYSRNISLTIGWNTISLTYPFYWDGSSDILIDYSYAGHKGSAVLQADTGNYNSSQMSKTDDSYLNFEGWDYVEVPANVFATIDSAITISFWQYGNPNVQPANASILEGVDSAGRRILNVHLPWSNKIVYWDAGRDADGVDRISLSANNTSLWEGKWNHWVFMKDARSGIMRIFHNGILWFQQSGKHKSMSGIVKFRIGAAITYDGYYAGMIDEFRVWDTVLGWDAIGDYMYKDIDTNHPFLSHLRTYYQFNNGEGLTVYDNSSNGFTGNLFGQPGWCNYQGVHRFRNPFLSPLNLHLALQNGVYDSAQLDSLVVVDTLPKTAVNIVFFDTVHPVQPVDTILKWPGYYNNYTFDAGGHPTDSSLVLPDSVLYHQDLPYYGAPYEVTVPWEIGRFITPYGNGLSLGDGFTWVYDVTDYAPFLHDSVHLTAGNFQELLNLKFYMIKGTPPRDVKKIEKVYSGYYYLNTFPEKVAPDTIALLPDALSFKIKTRTSGHLFSNPTNCAEFCEKIHYLDVNDHQVAYWQIVQECSTNPLYPQGGTWIYDRAGWCPGMKVTEHNYEITPYITDDTAIIDYNSQPDQYGAYLLVVQLFSYGAPNFNTDATVDEIIAPNNLKRYRRNNPSATRPIVVIKNLGADTLTSVDIVYGPSGVNPKTYHWTGNLPFMQKKEVQLTAFNWVEWQQGNGHFYVSLNNPNNTTDENTINDFMTSNYDLPPAYPTTFVIHFKTNKAAYQNSYEILTDDGEQVYEKHNFENTTLYKDTITLLGGIYDFYLWDSHDNGISFWANNEGSGYLKFYDLNGNILKSFNGDFGHNIYQCFYADIFLGNKSLNADKLIFDILPNPNNGIFTVSYALKEKENIEIGIVNVSGQSVYHESRSSERHGKIRINLPELPAGIYSLTINGNNVSESRKFVVK